jgi:hypothetical protein
MRNAIENTIRGFACMYNKNLKRDCTHTHRPLNHNYNGGWAQQARRLWECILLDAMSVARRWVRGF